MSAIMSVVWLKMSLPAPAPFLMFVNVARRFSPCWMLSAVIPVERSIVSASFAIWSAVTLAAPPVDFTTASDCPMILSTSPRSPMVFWIDPAIIPKAFSMPELTRFAVIRDPVRDSWADCPAAWKASEKGAVLALRVAVSSPTDSDMDHFSSLSAANTL